MYVEFYEQIGVKYTLKKSPFNNRARSKFNNQLSSSEKLIPMQKVNQFSDIDNYIPYFENKQSIKSIYNGINEYLMDGLKNYLKINSEN